MLENSVFNALLKIFHKKNENYLADSKVKYTFALSESPN
jgi:hypothetical protein